MDKKILILMVIITMIFASYISITNNNINNTINNTNTRQYNSDNGGVFYANMYYSLSGINLINHYLLLSSTLDINGNIGSQIIAYTDNSSFAYNNVYSQHPNVNINNGFINFIYNLINLLPSNYNATTATVVNTFIVYNNSIPFSSNGYNISLADNYYKPTIASYSYNITVGTSPIFTQNINYYNDIRLISIGYVEFESTFLFNLSINNIKYTNINNFNLTLPVGSYTYSVEYNNTFLNGSITINDINKQIIFLNFQTFVISHNYIFIVFILGITITALFLAYNLNRNFYAFFTIELFFLFIGYQANMPFITISIFALILFFIVFMLVYKLVLE